MVLGVFVGPRPQAGCARGRDGVRVGSFCGWPVLPFVALGAAVGGAGARGPALVLEGAGLFCVVVVWFGDRSANGDVGVCEGGEG